MTGWFGFKDNDMEVTTAVSRSGNASGYVTNAAGNVRFEQTIRAHSVETVPRANLDADLGF